MALNEEDHEEMKEICGHLNKTFKRGLNRHNLSMSTLRIIKATIERDIHNQLMVKKREAKEREARGKQ